MDIDLVHDDVERQLLKERDVIQKAELTLERVLDETSEQFRELKVTIYQIDQDLENKENNLQIDRRNAALKETDLDLSACHNTVNVDTS